MKLARTLIISCTTVSSFIACTKNTGITPGNETQLQATVSANAADEYNVQTDESSFSADADAAVAVNPSFSLGLGSATDSSTIADAIIDRSTITASFKGIKITYRGISVFGVKRTGEATIELAKGSSWLEAGAILKITFNGVAITYLDKTRTYNGTCYITNTSGGIAYVFPDTVVHTMRVNGTVKFEDNSTLTWWAARKNTFYKSDISFSSEGDTLINGERYSMGGTTRFNRLFLVKAPEAIVSNISCGLNKPVSGTRIFTSDNRNTTITFGVNQNGSPVASGDCAYGYKIEWTMWSNQNATLIISY